MNSEFPNGRYTPPMDATNSDVCSFIGVGPNATGTLCQLTTVNGGMGVDSNHAFTDYDQGTTGIVVYPGILSLVEGSSNCPNYAGMGSNLPSPICSFDSSKFPEAHANGNVYMKIMSSSSGQYGITDMPSGYGSGSSGT